MILCVIDYGNFDDKVLVQELFSTPTTLAAARISGYKNISRAHKVDEKILFCDEWGLSLTTALPVDEQVKYAGIRAHYFQVVDCASEHKNTIPCQANRVMIIRFQLL